MSPSKNELDNVSKTAPKLVSKNKLGTALKIVSKNSFDTASKSKFGTALKIVSINSFDKASKSKFGNALKAFSKTKYGEALKLVANKLFDEASKIISKMTTEEVIDITPKNKFEAFQDLLAYEQIIESLDNKLDQNINHIALSGIDSRNGASDVCEGLVRALSLSHNNVLFIKLYNKPKNTRNRKSDISASFEDAVKRDRMNGSVGISKVELYTEELPRPTSSKEKVLKEIIENLKNVFDVIIWDLPLADRAVHSRVIAQYTQGVILVIESGKTRWQTASHIMDHFRVSKCNILGVVLNNKKNYIPDWIYTLLFRAAP